MKRHGNKEIERMKVLNFQLRYPLKVSCKNMSKLNASLKKNGKLKIIFVFCKNCNFIHIFFRILKLSLYFIKTSRYIP